MRADFTRSIGSISGDISHSIGGASGGFLFLRPTSFGFKIRRLAIHIFGEGIHWRGPPDGFVQLKVESWCFSSGLAQTSYSNGRRLRGSFANGVSNSLVKKGDLADKSANIGDGLI